MRALLLAAIACLLVTPNAAAMTARPMSDATALHEMRMGLAWWTAHGVTGCPDGVRAGVAPDRELRAEAGTTKDVEGLATVLSPHVGGCEFVLAASTYDIYGANRSFEELGRTCRRRGAQFYCSDRVTVSNMRQDQSSRCAIIRHELGHAIGGLDDDEVSADDDITWVMAQNGLDPVFDDCEALAVATWRYRPRRMRPRRHADYVGATRSSSSTLIGGGSRALNP